MIPPKLQLPTLQANNQLTQSMEQISNS